MKYLYRIFDADGALLYVGQSRRPEKRIAQHSWRSEHPGWTSTIEGPFDEVLSEVLERRAIITERPQRNIIWRHTAWAPDGEWLLSNIGAASYLAGHDAVRWTKHIADSILAASGLAPEDGFYRLADLEAKYLERHNGEVAA